MGDAGHAIGSICLICVGSFLFLLMTIFFLPMGIGGLVLAAIIAGLIGSAIATSWWEGMIEGFFVGFPYLIIFGGSTYLLKSIVDMLGTSVSNSLLNSLSGILLQGILYIILIYAIVPMIVGGLIGYLKGLTAEKKSTTPSMPSYSQYSSSQNMFSSPNYYSKSKIMEIMEEIDKLKEEKKERKSKIDTLEEMKSKIPESEEVQWKIDQINKKLESEKYYFDKVNFELDENETLLSKIIDDYTPPLCENDGFPLRFVRSGKVYMWYCDLCNNYAEGWKDWTKISDISPTEKNERINKLLSAYTKLNKYYSKGKIAPQKYTEMKNIITKEINKLKGEKESEETFEVVSPPPEETQENFEILPDSIKIVCPQCGFESEITPDMIGKKVECPQCGHVFVAEIEESKEDCKKNEEGDKNE